jgi:hypothetical protein
MASANAARPGFTAPIIAAESVQRSLAAFWLFFPLNAIEDFADKKLYLRCRQIPCDEVRVNAQTQHCPRLAESFSLNHDLGY